MLRKRQSLMLMRFDAGKIAQFERDGFLVFDTELPQRDLDQVRAILMRLHNQNVGFKEGALFDAMGVDDGQLPRRFPQILHPR